MKKILLTVAVLFASISSAKDCQEATDITTSKNEFGETAGQKWTDHNEGGAPSTLCWTWGEKTEYISRPLPAPTQKKGEDYSAYLARWQAYQSSLLATVPVQVKTVRFSVTWTVRHTLLPDETKSFTTDELSQYATKDGSVGFRNSNADYFFVELDGKALAIIDGPTWQRQIKTKDSVSK